MAWTDVGGWLRRLLRKGGGDGDQGNGNGNGTTTLAVSVEPKKEIRTVGGNGNGGMANRIARRSVSELAFTGGVQDLTTQLIGIEEKLEIQNHHAARVSARLEHLATTLKSLPAEEKRSQALLQAIKDEIQGQSERGKEVASYLRSIPHILESLENGGAAQQTQLELTRGLVREVVCQGQKLALFQRGAAELSDTVHALAKLSRDQVEALKRVERGVRRGFDFANHTQLRVMDEARVSRKRTLIGGLCGLILAVGLVVGGAMVSMAYTDQALAETRTVQVEAPADPAPDPAAADFVGGLMDAVLDTFLGSSADAS